MERTRGAVQFDGLRNALYHKARQLWYERLNRLFNLAVIVLGTASAVEIFTAMGVKVAWLGAATAVVGAIQLVYDPAGRAKTHYLLQKRFYELLASVERVRDPTLQQLADWDAALVTIYADEPPTLRALDTIAYNEALASLGGDASERLKINAWQSLLRHLYPFNGSDFRPLHAIRAN